ncbi:YhgE/Pip domain-containing protein [Companilactobacillus mishanensis]|uniref:ABC-2 type transporter transmembrane domain-containing protein n=1 Tax=Companilactobacillus mishanensis TaxID=2486008 RepID=A0A5P0ZHU8_9LACO|nr:YhgE/Pip family protein [Companilactobacillus mishanensis]MQS52582.1 hypothetical protein [Companilactobacillus mishanensis]
MITSELKYIFKENRALFRILLGILLIPAFYAVIFLSSLWNPYQETQHLPVAVVNNDQSIISSTGKKFSIGHDLTHSLWNNKSLHFEFLSNKQAHAKLDSGKVYMIIDIPKNFSKQASKLMEPNAKQMTLKYYTSAGHSFVAMKMSTTAMNKIKNTLDNQISKSYVSSILSQTDQSEESLKESATKITSSQQLNLALDSITPLPTKQRIIDSVKLVHYDKTVVKNNGTGMAPYLMSVALFVGTITLNIIYDTYTPHKYPKNGFSWWSAKMPFLFGFIIVAATIMFVILTKLNGLEPLQTLKTYLFVLLTATTFVSIVTFFSLLMGMTGAWLMLLFMIIQLGGSAGNYPIELSNTFFQTIHPYLPMSISIDAFRSTISIGNSIMPEVHIFMTIFIVFNLAIMILFQVKMKKLNTAK